VEEVNKRVLKGVPFREAYKMVAGQIADGTYKSEGSVHHTHEGSIGHLCNDRIALKMENALTLFHFERKDKAIEELLKSGQ
jgi:argininosuccinate lyase